MIADEQLKNLSVNFPHIAWTAKMVREIADELIRRRANDARVEMLEKVEAVLIRANEVAATRGTYYAEDGVKLIGFRNAIALLRSPATPTPANLAPCAEGSAAPGREVAK